MARESVCKYKFTVEKHGRKWTQVVIQYASGKSGGKGFERIGC